MNTKYAGPCLYRGKSQDDNAWLQGFFFGNHLQASLLNSPYLLGGILHFMSHPIFCKTLSAWTGLVDKNGVKIFAGDIVSHEYKFGGGKGVVEFIGSGFALTQKSVWCNEIEFEECEVIGNVWDNPELLNTHHLDGNTPQSNSTGLGGEG